MTAASQPRAPSSLSSRPAEGGSPFFRPENMVHQTTKMSINKAARASSNRSHMVMKTMNGKKRGAPGRMLAGILGALGVALLAGCGSTPPPPAAPPPAAAAPAPLDVPPIVRERSRWQAVRWDELPGWGSDAVIHGWVALLRSCQKPAAGWEAACASAREQRDIDETRLRAWLQQQLQPYRVEAQDGNADGLITGYFEPLVEASRKRTARHTVPLHAPPADLARRKPWYTRSEIETLPAARNALRGREIAWVADPLDALLLQVQGSGRLRFADTQQVVRLAFAGHNDQPYQSVGRWLVDRGAFTLEQASWPAIKEWARANPARVKEMIHANPRYVFFREEPLPDPSVGPLGAQGVALTPGRSLAVDKASVPLGTLVWISTTEPQPWSPSPPPARPLQRLMVAQDTGGAITGAVRADYFWGWTEGAEEYAGRMKQPLRMWVLWPRR